MRAKEERRKTYFIKKQFQAKFIFRFCGLVIMGSVLSGICLYLFSRGTVTTTFINSRLSIVSTADYILPALLRSSLVTIVLISFATAFVVMYLSHRIAGPLFRFEKSAREIGEGNLTLKVRLRSTDEMAKLADCFNEMAEKLRKQLLEIKAQSESLKREIDRLTGLNDADFRNISEKKKALERAIDYFRI